MKKVMVVGAALVATILYNVVSANYNTNKLTPIYKFKHIALQSGTNTLTVINIAERNVIVYYTLREHREPESRHFEKEIKPGEKIVFDTRKYALINIDAERLVS